MHFRSIGPALGLLSLGLALATPAAHAAGPASDVYIGGGLSYSRASSLGGSIDGALANQGFGSSSSANSSSTNPDLRLGYRVSPNFAVEATYDQVGNLSVQSAIATPGTDNAVGAWKSRGLGLHVLGIAPVDDHWSMYARAGVEQWRTTLNLNSNAGGTTAVANTSSNTALALGLGTSYALTPNVDATGEFTHFNHVGDSGGTGRSGLNQFSVGLRYHFL